MAALGLPSRLHSNCEVARGLEEVFPLFSYSEESLQVQSHLTSWTGKKRPDPVLAGCDA